MALKIEKFDKEICRNIGIEVEIALKAIATKYGLTVTNTGGKFDDGSYSPRITFTADGAAEGTWRTHAPSFGLPVNAFGQTFTQAGYSYTITGLDLGKPKYCIKAKRTDNGKEYGFPAESVRRAFGMTGYAFNRGTDASAFAGLTETPMPTKEGK